MSARSRQAVQLAYLIEQRARLRRVECSWIGGGSDPVYSGWQLRWTDGPTPQQMRALVAQLAEQVPALPIGELRYSRGSTDLGEAIALLRHLDGHPDEAQQVSTFTIDTAFAAASYPETASPPWPQRARALLSLSRHTTLRGGEALHALAGRVRAHGWQEALAWLDAIAASADNPDVIDLAAHARERQP